MNAPSKAWKISARVRATSALNARSPEPVRGDTAAAMDTDRRAAASVPVIREALLVTHAAHHRAARYAQSLAYTQTDACEQNMPSVQLPVQR